MKTTKFLAGLLAVGAAVAFAFVGPSNAQAHDHGFGGYGGYGGYYGYGYVHPYYHAPTVHYHTTFHPEYTHWTPDAGVHTHGHYHVTPHYVPGHFHW